MHQMQAVCCHDNRLTLNTRKTKEIIIDFQKSRTTLHSGLSINEEQLEWVMAFKLLGLHISGDLDWEQQPRHQKSPAVSLLPENAEEEQTTCTSAEELVWMHNRECPNL